MTEFKDPSPFSGRGDVSVDSGKWTVDSDLNMRILPLCLSAEIQKNPFQPPSLREVDFCVAKRRRELL